MQAQSHHALAARPSWRKPAAPGDFVRTIKKVLDEETTRMENGLAVLATVGATAPFVGLFGTVWGVYPRAGGDRHERRRHARSRRRPVGGR